MAMAIRFGCEERTFINILLFILGVLPGALHAWYYILGSRGFRRILFSILAFILPPIPVFIKVECTKHLFINIVLTILGFLPGVIHALWIIWARRNWNSIR